MDDTEVCGELNDYLSLPIEKVHDPIGWWWDHKAMYPKLSHMAFDYLSVSDMCIRIIKDNYADKPNSNINSC